MYANRRYRRKEATVSSSKIAIELNSEQIGPPTNLTGFDDLSEAKPSDLSFCREGYEETLKTSEAGAVISAVDIDGGPTLIPSPTPKSDFVHIVREHFLEKRISGDIHPTANVSPSAVIGDGCLIAPNVIIGEGVTIGDNCIIGPGTTIGQAGFGYQVGRNGAVNNMFHEGNVVIEDNVHIGANCTIDRSVANATTVGKGSKIHHLVHIAHNAKIGKQNLINQFVSVSGSVSTGNDVRIHPHAVISSQTTVGDNATIGANSAVLDNVEPSSLVVGSPAKAVER